MRQIDDNAMPPLLKPRGDGSREILTRLLALAIALLVVGTFWRVTGFEFVGYDDITYVIGNPRVCEGLTTTSLGWALTTLEAANWHPLTWISHMADVSIFGMNPGGHHLTSLLLHACNSAILFQLLRALTGAIWPSAFVAAVFAVHPLHVESVAWVSERKDLLSTFYWGLAVTTYLFYVRTRRRLWYVWLLFSFGAALMAKPMVVTLPALLIILDYWPLGRFHRPRDGGPCLARIPDFRAALVEKIPLIALAVASSAITAVAQNAGGMVKSTSLYPLAVRALNAALAYGGYIVKTLWPHALAIPYPHRGSELPVGLAIGSGVVLVTASVAVLRLWRRVPYLTAGWLWFIVGLAPVIGLVQVADQAMADRYTYVPLNGLLIAFAWGAAAVTRSRRSFRLSLALNGMGVVAALVPFAASQAMHWRSMEALVTHALAVTKDNYLAQMNMGRVRLSQKKVDEAVLHFEEAIRINPRFSYPYYHLGSLRLSQGREEEAAAWFERTLAVNPGFFEAQNDLGVVLSRRGQVDEAIQLFRDALRTNPWYVAAYYNLGINLAKQGRLDEAMASYREALRFDPSHARARAGLANVLFRVGRVAEAEAVIREGSAVR